jgi:GntR family transcriptional regulator
MPIPMSYEQIVEDLIDRIEAGEYKPGEQLPTYHALSKLYGVSYATISRVILILRDRKVVIGVPGHGVFVPEGRSGRSRN